MEMIRLVLVQLLFYVAILIGSSFAQSEQQWITDFYLVDSSQKIVVGTLPDGSKVNLSAFSRGITIVAYTIPGMVGSVEFFLDSKFYKKEIRPPYFINGHNGQWAAPLGLHTIVAVPYSREGDIGISKGINITFFREPSGNVLQGEGTEISENTITFQNGNIRYGQDGKWTLTIVLVVLAIVSLMIFVFGPSFLRYWGIRQTLEQKNE